MNIKRVKNQKTSNRFTRDIPKAKSYGVLPSSLRGLGVCFLSAIILLFAVSAFVYSLPDPNRYIAPAALIVLYVSAMIGGCAAVKINGGSALLCGLATGGMFAASLFALSLFMNDALSVDRGVALSVGLRAVIVATAVLGAYAGVQNKRKKPKKR